MKPMVAVVMGSRSDMPVMRHCCTMLKRLGIAHTRQVLSAHRQPRAVADFADGAQAAGYRVIIAGAGMAAHLAGAIAARTTLPVIGVPLASGPLRGVDAFLSTLQMPAGGPVATMSIGKAGAINAALLAARMLGISSSPAAAGSGRARSKRR